MGQKRGKDEGSFVRETRTQIFDFYRDFVQVLKPWQARAPRLREQAPAHEAPATPQPDPPAFGGDGRDPGEAPDVRA
jgi:hypothetical protein